ncbi:hypothetical protein AAT19DRAFT_14332 [Rhodotorula toruloides]|uniref:Uncharacterized protein n=1 Tax=Rhodotorula toruloides TaxID=5286 RepID=A0A2T0ABD7_RHOTO|nr:hypothetical protein AAT19DRAFT_14332 [Rhodotorula toruloides]
MVPDRSLRLAFRAALLSLLLPASFSSAPVPLPAVSPSSHIPHEPIYTCSIRTYPPCCSLIPSSLTDIPLVLSIHTAAIVLGWFRQSFYNPCRARELAELRTARR